MRIRLLIIAVLFTAANCFSQSITPYLLNNSGGFFKKDSYQLEWSIGELALVNQMEARSYNFILTNGFLQSYTLFPANYSFATVFDVSEIKILPNPASSYVEINFLTKQKGKVTFGFYDASGKKVYSNEVNCYGVDLIHRIPVNRLASGTYMLHISLDRFPGYYSKWGVYKLVVIH